MREHNISECILEHFSCFLFPEAFIHYANLGSEKNDVISSAEQRDEGPSIFLYPLIIKMSSLKSNLAFFFFFVPLMTLNLLTNSPSN